MSHNTSNSIAEKRKPVVGSGLKLEPVTVFTEASKVDILRGVLLLLLGQVITGAMHAIAVGKNLAL